MPIYGSKKVFFVSKDAAWQAYRNEVLTCLAKKFNCRVEILTTCQPEEYLRENTFLRYRSFFSIFPHKWKPSFFPMALGYIIKNRPDVVLCLDNTTQLTEYCALIICKLFKIRFVWWTHAYNPTRVYKSSIVRTIRQSYAVFFLKHGDAIITFSSLGRQYLLDRAVDPKKIVCAPNTLDTEKLIKLAERASGEFTKEQLCNEFLLPANGRFILFMGRLLKEKRVEHAIGAIPLIKKFIPNIHLIVIGDGPNKQNLINFAKFKAAGSVTFAGAIFDDSLKAKYFALSEIFVMPGYVGLAIVHAFCYGLPLVTENINFHAPEIQYLKNGENGYFVEDGNIEEMAEKIIELLADCNKLSAFSQRAVDTIKNEADINFMIEQMARALKIKNTSRVLPKAAKYDQE